MGHYRCFEPTLVRPGQAIHRYSRASRLHAGEKPYKARLKTCSNQYTAPATAFRPHMRMTYAFRPANAALRSQRASAVRSSCADAERLSVEGSWSVTSSPSASTVRIQRTQL